MGSKLNRLTAGAPRTWAPIRYRVLDEFRRDMKNMAWANLLMPAVPFGNRITGRELESRTVLTVLSSCVEELTVDPPTIIAVVPRFSNPLIILGRFSENFSGSIRARCMQLLSRISSSSLDSTGPVILVHLTVQ